MSNKKLMLYREQTFAPRAFHSELQQQTNTVNTQKSPPWACDKECAEACAERFSALKNENGSEWSNGTVIFQSDQSNREKWSTLEGGPVFSKLFLFDRTDPLRFGPKFPESLVEWIAPSVCSLHFTPGPQSAVRSLRFTLTVEWICKSYKNLDQYYNHDCSSCL